MYDRILEVVLQSLFAFVVLFIISKMLGKKQVAQLEFNDYVIGISIGSIAAQMAIEPDIPTYHFVIAIVIFALLDFLITIVSRKGNSLKIIFKGRPLILIKDGNLIYNNIKKSKLDLNEIMSQCRIKGYFDINEIAYCIFETNGQFSILPKSNSRELTASDFNLPKKTMDLSNDIIIDGEIVIAALKKINKDLQWLYDNLNIKTKKDIKNIFLASYNEQENKFYIHYKKPHKENLNTSKDLNVKAQNKLLKNKNKNAKN